MNQPAWREATSDNTANRGFVIYLAWLLLAVIFASDGLTPLGFAHGMLYCPLVLMAAYGNNPAPVRSIAAAGVVCTLVGLWISPPAPPGFDLIYVLLNRLLAVVTIVATALLAVAVMRNTQRLEASNRQLIEARSAIDRKLALLNIAGEIGQFGGWDIAVASNRVRWTQESYRIHGLDPGTTIDTASVIDLYVPADRSRIRECLQQCAERGQPFDEEFQLVRPDGTEVWLRVLGRPKRNQRGEITRLRGAVQDISQTKATAHSLARSEQSFRELAEAMPMIVWTADPGGQVDFSTSAMFDYTGLPRDQQAAVQSRHLLPHPDDLEQVTALWHQAVANSEPFSAEVRLRRHDGVYRWHLLRASLVRGDDGSPLKWYGTTIDIDDERRRGKEFEEIALRLHTTLESITDGFMTLDREWRFTFMTSQAQSITRLRSEEVLGNVLWDIMPQMLGTVFETEFRRAVAEQVSLAFNAYYRPLDLWVDVKAYPSEEGLAIYFHDHSVRRKLEQQLRESQRLETVGHLTGGMAHDFNNLLTVILGNAEILGDSLPQGSSLHSLADMVVAAAERGADLTQRLLAFARRQPLEPEVLDINRLISNLDSILRRTLGGHIDIEWVRAPALWPALVDRAQLESAVLNLAINARDAMPQRGRLTIETANTRLDQDYVRGHGDLKAGQYVMVAVSDTGTGITPDNLRRVFEPFFTTKEVGRGTGLGLSTVFGFIKQSGGHINIYSEEGEGTTLKMYLPRAFGEQEVTCNGGEEPAPVAAGGDAIILLVEDDDLVRDYASQQLTDAGYQVLCAANGREGLAVLEARRDIDLLFTDVVMPGGMSGRELADRAQEAYPSLRVLYTSGYTENAIVHHGRLDPGVQLLNKPYRRALLLDKVRQVLGSR